MQVLTAVQTHQMLMVPVSSVKSTQESQVLSVVAAAAAADPFCWLHNLPIAIPNENIVHAKFHQFHFNVSPLTYKTSETPRSMNKVRKIKQKT